MKFFSVLVYRGVTNMEKFGKYKVVVRNRDHAQYLLLDLIGCNRVFDYATVLKASHMC